MQTHRIQTIAVDPFQIEAELTNTRRFGYSDAYSEFTCGEWRSCMLWNKSGDVEDNFLEDYDHPAQMTSYGKQMSHLADVLRNTFNMAHLRFARLAKLTPGSVLIPHRDYLELKQDLTRVHIPLATDSCCYSAEESTVYQMKQGEVWYIDATQIHSAACFSKKSRTHLILDFTEVARIDTVLAAPTSGPQSIPCETIAMRKPLGEGEKKAFMGLAGIIDPANYKDVLGLIIKKYFTTDIPAATVFDWLFEIARLSKDPEVLARVEWHREHCLIQR